MIPRTILFAPITLLAAPLLLAQAINEPQPPPPVAHAMPAAPQTLPPPAEQRVYAPAGGPLIAPQAAQTIVDGFRNAYQKAGAAPRIVVYVNRALVDTSSGMKLAGHTENYEQGGSTNKTSGTNSYKFKDAPTASLADQQTVREIERLFGRAFRNAGAQLADQKTATALLPDQPGAHVLDQAARDRAALSRIADIAIEVLISSRNLTVPEVSGDVTYPVPDIQATAIRLKDSAIVGQAAASDIIGKGASAGRVVRQFDVQDITEATALALMEDMQTK
jgi:hypothetical protein